VRIVTKCGGGCSTLQAGELKSDDLAHLSEIQLRAIDFWIPDMPIEASREMYKRSALHLHDIQTVSDFYFNRAKLALSQLWYRINEVEPNSIREALRFAFTNTAWHASRMRRFNARGGQRPLTGTLYIPQLVSEPNVFEVFRHQLKQIAAYYGTFTPGPETFAFATPSSATNLEWIPDASIDYVFTDPPFGSNIFYADCNLVWEAWLGEITDTAEEIVVNRSRSLASGGKTIDDYGSLLTRAFSEMRRVIHPQGRISIVFHNADDRVWSSMLGAAENAGLRQIEVSLLDKGQRSMKGYRGRAGLELVPFYDLVITFSPGHHDIPVLNGAGEIALNALTKHLVTMDQTGLPIDAQERSLEYLYSLAVASVIREGAQPHGLSFRALEALATQRFQRNGQHFSSRNGRDYAADCS
jgi:hypothetical protein